MSPLHCELRVRGEHVELRDLDSDRGTYLDGRRVYQVALKPGDRFMVGEVHFQIVNVDEIEVEVSALDQFEGLWGQCTAMREVFASLGVLAPTAMSVLVVGETGTGKREAARALHQRSGREGAFVIHDCANPAADALEAAFTQASGGTLLLDELPELPMDVQARTLRWIDRREGRRDARSEPEVRIVATTRTDLTKLVANRCFRDDLYHRIAQAVVELPPLRERGDDVELLAAQLLADQAQASLADDAQQLLREYRWPGNVRELRNAIQRAAHLARGSQIHASHLGVRDQPPVMSLEELLAMPYRDALTQLDRLCLQRIMTETGGNITHAALRIGTSRRALRERLKRLGLYTSG